MKQKSKLIACSALALAAAAVGLTLILTGTGKPYTAAELDTLHQQILASHQELIPAIPPLAAENNRLAQFVALVEREADQLDTDPIPPELEDLISRQEGTRWNPDLARQWLARHSGLVSEIIRISALPNSSFDGVDAVALSDSNASNQIPKIARLLTIRLRLQMDEKDYAGAAETCAAAVSLGDSLSRGEGANLLSSVLGIGMQATVWNSGLQPQLEEGSASLEDLRQIGKFSRPVLPAAGDFASVFRGEWVTELRLYTHPETGAFSAQERTLLLRNPEDFFAAVTAVCQERIRQAERGDIREIINLAPSKALADAGSLNKQQRKFLSVVDGMTRNVIKGWITTAVHYSMSQAAIAAATGEKWPLDPITGKPFRLEKGNLIATPDDPLYLSVPIGEVEIPVVKTSGP